ncbi:hypothetical protein [Burkholderia sp. JKS000303]|uniref:hypothetical protein n=1 Tax=Burkholderia sp. JKS000303 TaxID=1938747 RepID=UPI000C00C8F9|nr:hypothetical protein [Burkholderia sp. JKS000303]PFH12853.1 hypothetical protein BX604_7273 [Burkholderia sp. JKS000303]
MATDTIIPSATQPNATTTLEGVHGKIDDAVLRRVGADLASRFTQYETDRRIAELRWEMNARQYLGIYDPDIESKLDKNRSRAYPKLTRVKCVSMLSRLMNLLFPTDDKNWTVAASPVPDLDEKDLQSVLDSLMQAAAPQMQAPGMPAPPTPAKPSDEAIEQAIRDFAKSRAKRMELEIEDQLAELGGARMADYVALCRKVLSSGIRYGCGILKGPFVEEQTQRRWGQDAAGRLVAQPYTAYRPRFEFVPIWDYYPDMSAKALNQMDGQFERVVMSKHQVIMLKQRQDFMASQIDAFLRESPTGNYVRRAFETELRAMGSALNVSQAARNKFEAIVWEGYMSGRDMANMGVDVPDDKLDEDVRANVWVMGNRVIRAQLDPWSKLKTDGEMPMYHHFIFEEDESFLLGNGLPQIMRDSQMGLCAAVRMALDNGAVQRVFEINTRILNLHQDIEAINPDHIFYRDDDQLATMQYPAIRSIDLQSHLGELQSLAKMFQEFADTETFVNPATGGDLQKGPSEPFRTAAGASMLRGDAALPFKDVVRSFDAFTESVVGALLVFNRNFNSDQSVQGDFKPVARGATSLIAKEVLGSQLDQYAQTLQPEERPYIKWPGLARARARVRDLDTEEVVMNDSECQQVDEQRQQQAAAQQAQAQQMAAAEVRKLLSDSLKNLSQAGKNAANAEATTANTILGALEKGLNPDQVSAPNLMETGNGAGTAAAGAAPDGRGAGAAGASGVAGGAVGPVVAPAALANAAQGSGLTAAAMPAG